MKRLLKLQIQKIQRTLPLIKGEVLVMFSKKLLPIEEPSLIRANRKEINCYDFSYAFSYDEYDKDTLIINIFKNIGEKLTRFIAHSRVFIRKEEYITYVYESGKWSTSSIERLIWFSPRSIREYNKDIANKYLNLWSIKNNEQAIVDIKVLQQKLMDKRRAKKYAKERISIDKEMHKFKDRLTKPMMNFLIKDVFIKDNFMFYDKKHEKGYCTHCDKEVALKGIKYYHNMEGTCPNCKKTVLYKSKGMGRKYLCTQGTGVIYEKNNNQLLARYFDIIKDYSKDFTKPDVTIKEVLRTVFSDKIIRNYEKRNFHNLSYDWCRCAPHQTYNYYNYDIRYISHENYGVFNLSNAIKNTYFENSQANIWESKCGKNVWSVENYMDAYIKHPLLESLIKIGFYDIANSVCGHIISINDNEAKLHKALGITKEQFNILNKIQNPRVELLNVMKANDTGVNYTKEQYKFICNLTTSEYRINNIFELLKKVSFTKFKKYIKNKDLCMYIDYIKFCKKLNWDLKNTFVAKN